MIDRGALVVGPSATGPYRGPHRTPLDGMTFTGKPGRRLARRYADAVVAGEGVLEGLDEALDLRDEARVLGLGEVEVIIFEVPQDPYAPGRLEVLPTPPAEGLVLFGHDVIQPLEPYASLLSDAGHGHDVNEHGLLATRRAAEELAARRNAEGDADEAYVAARVWAVA